MRIRLVMFVLLICAMFCVCETNFVFVCAHARPSPSIRIQIGSKYEMYHLIGRDG